MFLKTDRYYNCHHLLSSKLFPTICCSGEISITRMESIVPSCPACLLCTLCDSPLICGAKPTQEWAHDLDQANECLLRSFAGTLHGGVMG